MKKDRKPKRCPDCKDGTLYLIGARWCCTRCTYGWIWHRSEKRKGKEAA